MRNEWGEDRGEGNSEQKAPPLPGPLLHRMEEREKTVLPIGFKTVSAPASPRVQARNEGLFRACHSACCTRAGTSQREVPIRSKLLNTYSGIAGCL